MKKLSFGDMIVLLQDCLDFDVDAEDVINSLESGELFSSGNGLADEIIVQVFAEYDQASSNSVKLDGFLSVLENIRGDLNLVEQSIEIWEEILDGDYEED